MTHSPTARTTTRRPRRRRLTTLAVCMAVPAAALGAGQAMAATGLAPGQTLSAGATLVSPNGLYRLQLQAGDGNIVEWGPSGVMWTSNTGGMGGSRLVMQSDGNLVEYSATGQAVFATGSTTGDARTSLEVQNDGNLVVYSGSRTPMWASQTSYERAIQWFYNHRGSTAYEGRCELAVENAFGTSGRYSTARANWNGRAQNVPVGRAPRGSLVFYNTSSAAHVAVSLGNGTVASSSAGGRIGIVPIGYFQRPLGWGWAPW